MYEILKCKYKAYWNMNMFLFSVNIYVGLSIIEIIYMNNIIEIIQENEIRK